MMKSSIRLFKSLPIETKRKKKAYKGIARETIKCGFTFSPEVYANYSEEDLIGLIKDVKAEFGLTAEQMNASFHKSWKKVKESSIELLVMEQLIHYLTTYGFEEMGIYSEESVYIPAEKLEIPELKDDIKLIIIHGLTKKELKKKVINLLKTGIALGSESIDDVMDVIKFVDGIDEAELANINNKEVKVRLYDGMGLIPENPTEFLRFVIYKAIDSTTIIKDKKTITAIKEVGSVNKTRIKSIQDAFCYYNQQHGFTGLATIFYRFKPLFLAFRQTAQLKSDINTIRRLAVANHKPMPEDFLNEITAKIKKKIKIDDETLAKELAKANTFRKIRLAYALKFRTTDPNSVLYRVRNGKGYAKEFEGAGPKTTSKKVLKTVIDSITEGLKEKLDGKKIHIPKHMNYTLPSTEKMFTGDMPTGSYISMPKNMVFGIQWHDTDGHRIDLDLSMINGSNKIGWDGDYRNSDSSILFSGDLTCAGGKDGASELFYVKKQSNGAHILMVNYYNFNEDVEVPMKIVVGKADDGKYFNGNSHMLDPNKVLAVAKTSINQKQKVLGLIITTAKECRFYFTETYIGKSITAYGNAYIEHSKQYLFDYYRNAIGLKSILENAGAVITDTAEECDIDLSPETIGKDTIINLIK